MLVGGNAKGIARCISSISFPNPFGPVNLDDIAQSFGFSCQGAFSNFHACHIKATEAKCIRERERESSHHFLWIRWTDLSHTWLHDGYPPVGTVKNYFLC